jgi:hypothetical protein
MPNLDAKSDLPAIEELQSIKFESEKVLRLAKRIGMKKKHHRKRIATLLIVIWVTPGLTRGQSSTPGPMPAPPKLASVIRPKQISPPKDDFAALKLTADQKAKIEQLDQDMKLRLDAVAKDERLTAEQ